MANINTADWAGIRTDLFSLLIIDQSLKARFDAGLYKILFYGWWWCVCLVNGALIWSSQLMGAGCF